MKVDGFNRLVEEWCSSVRKGDAETCSNITSLISFYLFSASLNVKEEDKQRVKDVAINILNKLKSVNCSIKDKVKHKLKSNSEAGGKIFKTNLYLNRLEFVLQTCLPGSFNETNLSTGRKEAFLRHFDIVFLGEDIFPREISFENIPFATSPYSFPTKYLSINKTKEFINYTLKYVPNKYALINNLLSIDVELHAQKEDYFVDIDDMYDDKSVYLSAARLYLQRFFLVYFEKEKVVENENPFEKENSDEKQNLVEKEKLNEKVEISFLNRHKWRKCFKKFVKFLKKNSTPRIDYHFGLSESGKMLQLEDEQRMKLAMKQLKIISLWIALKTLEDYKPSLQSYIESLKIFGCIEMEYDTNKLMTWVREMEIGFLQAIDYDVSFENIQRIESDSEEISEEGNDESQIIGEEATSSLQIVLLILNFIFYLNN